MLTVLLDGIAYGMVLFILASGLSVTLGLMNFLNLAHGAFAMAGGYVVYWLVNKVGVSFFLALPASFLAAACLGVLFERALYRHLYTRGHLAQVLFSIGLVLMSIVVADLVAGSQPVFIALPGALSGQMTFGHVGIGRYRLFLIVTCGLLTVALQYVLVRTRFGSQLRAAVDDANTARALGIRVTRVFVLTFAVGSGLAGLGGALGAEIMTLEPTFPLKTMVYFLIVVAVGGTETITGPLLAAIMLGVADVMGKYYVPDFGPFAIYTFMLVTLLLRPSGLFAGSRA